MVVSVEKTYTLVLSEEEVVAIREAVYEASAQLEYVIAHEDLSEREEARYKEDIDMLDKLYEGIYDVTIQGGNE